MSTSSWIGRGRSGGWREAGSCRKRDGGSGKGAHFADWGGAGMGSVEAVSLFLAQPSGGNPLWFPLQQVDLVQELLVGTVGVAARKS